MPQLAPMSQGRVDMRYRPVDCAPPAGMALNVLNGQGGSGFFKFIVAVRPADGTVPVSEQCC